MRGLKKNRMERGQTRKHTNGQTLRLLDRIGPVGRFDEKNKELDNRTIIITLIIHVAPHINGFSLGEKRKAYPKATPIGPILVQAWKAGKAKSLNNKNLNLFWGVCIASLWAVYTHQ